MNLVEYKADSDFAITIWCFWISDWKYVFCYKLKYLLLTAQMRSFAHNASCLYVCVCVCVYVCTARQISS